MERKFLVDATEYSHCREVWAPPHPVALFTISFVNNLRNIRFGAIRACGLATPMPFAGNRWVGTGMMRRLAWAGATLILMALSFAAGKMTLGERIMPEIVATLPNDESQFSRELDARLRERFPVGTSQDKLIGYLVGANFVPDWPRGDTNASQFVFDGLMCERSARVLWRADPAGALTYISGAYESHCL
jgi:hypothetical protein